MTKKIIAVILALAAVLAFAGCGKKAAEDEDKDVRSESQYNFLVLGHDRAANLTDVIMLISYDTEAGSISLMQIPRDTYIDYGGNNNKINSFFSAKYSEAVADKSKEPDLDAAKAVSEELEKTLCVKIHYATVMDLDGFEQIVDAIDGVKMNVPYDMHYVDKKQELYIDLKKGEQTLDGETAEQFVRFRSGYNQADIGRGNAQKMFMTAFIQSVKDNLTVSKLDDVASAVIDYVHTEMKTEDIVYFGKYVLDLDLSKVTMLTMPGEAKTSEGVSYYVMNRAAVIDIIQNKYNIYNFDITDEIFDKDHVYCNTNDDAMFELYNSPAEDAQTNEFNAQDIAEEPIDISLKK